MPNAPRNSRNTPSPLPHEPVAWELVEAASVQALARGDANEDQQRRAVMFIIERVCATYDLSYRPGDTQAMAFAEGKRFVGLQLVKLIRLNLAVWSDDNAREQHSNPAEHR